MANNGNSDNTENFQNTNTSDVENSTKDTKEATIVDEVNAEKSNIDRFQLENQFFFEDEIFSIDQRGRAKFGMITETFESFEDEDPDEIVGHGEVRVAWYPLGDEEVRRERQIGLADRSLMPGDVVRRLTPGTNSIQSGYCREINMRCDVKVVGTNYVLKNVSAERLRPISSWHRDTVVCLDSWVGSTKEIEEKAILRSPYGARIEIPSRLFWVFEDAPSKPIRGVYDPIVLYRGSTVIGKLPSLDKVKILKPFTSIPLTKKGKPMASKFYVEDVYLDTIWVHWQCKALSDGDLNPETICHPDPCVTGEALKRLRRINIFDACMVQMGDRSYLTFSQCDKINYKSDWNKEQNLKYSELFRQQQRTDYQEMFTQVAGPSLADIPHRIIFSEKSKKKLIENRIKKVLIRVDKLTPASTSKSHCCETSQKALDLPTCAKAEQSKTDLSSEMDISVASVNDSENAAKVIETPEKKSNVTESKQINYMGKRNRKCCSLHLNRKRSTKRLPKTTYRFPSKVLPDPQFGNELVTETLLVYSGVTVVWQDGSTEFNIPSNKLYPVHHLDSHEFFPGDFVISTMDNSDASFREYGVIQCVDHDARTARVKWFMTYTTINEPTPTQVRMNEVSVYDLKDHPDFQYRPGTMVIRVANFTGTDLKCTAGQIIDNCIDGQVKVWWVDGHISLCWPQDLFEVGHYEGTDWGNETDDSWETESEQSETELLSGKKVVVHSNLLSHLEHAHNDMSSLEEVFKGAPRLESFDVVHKLLIVYKNCRKLDRIFNFNFFHEDFFKGLVERVRTGPIQSFTERYIDRNYRLFNDSNADKDQNTIPVPGTLHEETPLLFANKSQHSVTSTPLKNAISSTPLPKVLCYTCDCPNGVCEDSCSSNNRKHDLLRETTKHLEKACKTSTQIANHFASTSKQKEQLSQCDSGQGDETVLSAVGSLMDLTSVDNIDSENNLENVMESKMDDTHLSGSLETNFTEKELACMRLCGIIKTQLKLCAAEIRSRFGYEVIKNFPDEESEYYIKEDSDVEMPEILDETSNNEESLETNDLSITVNLPVECDVFKILPNAPKSHKFYQSVFIPVNAKYYKAIQKEYRVLQNALPTGIWIRAFEDRMDLLSFMIEGPKNTPYEDGMFIFDVQLGIEYPRNPPFCHYVSFCSDRLNPNLYEDGKVCVSLLGTWAGRDTEVWGPTSTLLQVIVSIQGLILVTEPYYNEAGYEKQRGSQQGQENAHIYNEMVLIKMVQATTRMIKSPPELFKEEIFHHYRNKGMKMFNRINGWLEISKNLLGIDKTDEDCDKKLERLKRHVHPYFSLFPASRGFCISLETVMPSFFSTLKEKILHDNDAMNLVNME